MTWTCCQIGAREHYAVPRALNRHGALQKLVTDAWSRPGNLAGSIIPAFKERYHVELSAAEVSAWNSETLLFEASAKLRRRRGWALMMARNAWFQRFACSRLSAGKASRGQRTIFAFSYAALDIFRFARKNGWRTVLGQIDAGPPEEQIVAGLYAQEPELFGRWDRPPVQYWAAWREECALADRIVVNSAWSQQALEETGIPRQKIRIIPLAYESPEEAARFERRYPRAFTISRPLRVLFLGSICARKGVGPLFNAIRLLRGEAVEFWFAGSLQVAIPPDLAEDPHVRWIGPVPRSATSSFYREADLFMFPTFSDGFGLTQLEAQAWKLPIVTTRFCGDVVEHGRNGWLLPAATGEEIAAEIRRCIVAPQRLQEYAANAVQGDAFELTQIGTRWLGVFDEPASGESSHNARERSESVSTRRALTEMPERNCGR